MSPRFLLRALLFLVKVWYSSHQKSGAKVLFFPYARKRKRKIINMMLIRNEFVRSCDSDKKSRVPALPLIFR
jgi:hypothetical protein